MNPKKAQNFVREDYFNGKFSIRDTAFTPCTIMFYPYKINGHPLIHYCHFDENNFFELKSFADVAKEKDLKKIALLGGHGSNNIPKLISYLKRVGLEKLTDYSFVDSPPIRTLHLSDKGLELKSKDNATTFYSLEKLKYLFE